MIFLLDYCTCLNFSTSVFKLLQCLQNVTSSSSWLQAHCANLWSHKATSFWDQVHECIIWWQATNSFGIGSKGRCPSVAGLLTTAWCHNNVDLLQVCLCIIRWIRYLVPAPLFNRQAYSWWVICLLPLPTHFLALSLDCLTSEFPSFFFSFSNGP